MEIENIFRSTALAAGLMEIEHLIRSTALVLDHTGLIGYSFFHTPLVEGRSHAQTQSIRGDADRNGALVPA